MNSEINEKIIKDFLESYNLGRASFKSVDEGLSSFALLVIDKDKKYILKIYDKKSNIETEAKFGKFLDDNNVPVAKIIRNTDDDLISSVDNFKSILFNFCEGEPIKWENISNLLSENLAETVAQMHSLMMDNNSISAKDYRMCEISSSSGITNQKIAEKIEEVKKERNEIDLSNSRIALIHADLTRGNILTNKDRNSINAIIDFGDAHNDYIAWDLAVLITHVFITKTYGIDWNALSTFIKKYYSLFPLLKNERNLIIPFIKIRNINLAVEVNISAKKDKENIKELLSIENSVMKKLDLVEKNQSRLAEIIRG